MNVLWDLVSKHEDVVFSVWVAATKNDHSKGSSYGSDEFWTAGLLIYMLWLFCPFVATFLLSGRCTSLLPVTWVCFHCLMWGWFLLGTGYRSHVSRTCSRAQWLHCDGVVSYGAVFLQWLRLSRLTSYLTPERGISSSAEYRVWFFFFLRQSRDWASEVKECEIPTLPCAVLLRWPVALASLSLLALSSSGAVVSWQSQGVQTSSGSWRASLTVAFPACQ